MQLRFRNGAEKTKTLDYIISLQKYNSSCNFMF